MISTTGKTTEDKKVLFLGLLPEDFKDLEQGHGIYLLAENLGVEFDLAILSGENGDEIVKAAQGMIKVDPV